MRPPAPAAMLHNLCSGLLILSEGCRHLSLSTNAIEKIGSLAGMDSLRSLSLGRNQIKKLENLEAVASTLEEVWVSYNLLERLVRTLFSLVMIACKLMRG